MIIPSCVDELSKSVTERLRMLEDGKSFNFAFLNDPHYCLDYVERAFYAVCEINKKFPVEFFRLGGDILIDILEVFKEGKGFSAKAENGIYSYDIKCDFTNRGCGNLAGYIPTNVRFIA